MVYLVRYSKRHDIEHKSLLPNVMSYLDSILLSYRNEREKEGKKKPKKKMIETFQFNVMPNEEESMVNGNKKR
jgi:hypothetical protein